MSLTIGILIFITVLTIITILYVVFMIQPDITKQKNRLDKLDDVNTAQIIESIAKSLTNSNKLQLENSIKKLSLVNNLTLDDTLGRDKPPSYYINRLPENIGGVLFTLNYCYGMVTPNPNCSSSTWDTENCRPSYYYVLTFVPNNPGSVPVSQTTLIPVYGLYPDGAGGAYTHQYVRYSNTNSKSDTWGGWVKLNTTV